MPQPAEEKTLSIEEWQKRNKAQRALEDELAGLEARLQVTGNLLEAAQAGNLESFVIEDGKQREIAMPPEQYIKPREKMTEQLKKRLVSSPQAANAREVGIHMEYLRYKKNGGEAYAFRKVETILQRERTLLEDQLNYQEARLDTALQGHYIKTRLRLEGKEGNYAGKEEDEKKLAEYKQEETRLQEAAKQSAVRFEEWLNGRDAEQPMPAELDPGKSSALPPAMQKALSEWHGAKDRSGTAVPHKVLQQPTKMHR